jgi:hypothetical protein
MPELKVVHLSSDVILVDFRVKTPASSASAMRAA